jgi:predicted RNase H-like HicB family nuclease
MQSKYRYEIKIRWSETDQAYIANVTEIEFCTAHGESYYEALKNMEEAIDGWIKLAKEDGLEIPKPLCEYDPA